MIYYKVNNLNFRVKYYTTWAKAIVLIHGNIGKTNISNKKIMEDKSHIILDQVFLKC